MKKYIYFVIGYFSGRMRLHKKMDVKFGFTCFDHVISGIAFKEKEGIVASFKLQKASSLPIKGKKSHFLIFKIIFKGSGREVYDFFRQFFLEESKHHAKCITITDGHVECYLELSEGELEKTMKKIENFLKKNY